MPRRPSLVLLAVLLGACVSSLASKVPGGAELESQCKTGSGVACRDLGFLVLRHQRDAGGEAAQFFLRGCDTDPESCLAFAQYIDTPVITHRQRLWALKTLVYYCEQNRADICTRTGDAFLNDRPTALDLEAAVEAYSRGCKLGDARGCYLLSRVRAEGRYGVMRDEEASAQLLNRAVELYEEQCARGGLSHCDFLETLYRNGNPVPVNLAALQRVRATACDAGSEKACRRGPDVQWPSDAGWDELSCAVGEPDKCWAVAWHLRKRGADEDVALAHRLDTWACANGAKHSCTDLADALIEDGGTREDGRAVELLRRGCELGAPRACDLLRDATEAGQLGLAPDPDAGAVLFDRMTALYEASCMAGESSHCLYLDQLYASVRPPMKLERVLALRKKRCSSGQVQPCRQGPEFEWLTDAGSAHLISCAVGNAEGCSGYAYDLRETGNPAFLQKAALLDTWACDRDDAFGCASLAASSVADGGLAFSPPLTWERYRRACETGNAHYCCVLAIFLRDGGQEEAQVLDRRAFALSAEACGAGDMDHCPAAAGYAIDGVRLPRDLKRLYEFYALMCEAKIEKACAALAWGWRFGVHAPMDLSKAIPLLEGACQSHTNLRACEELASLYGAGRKVKKSAGESAKFRAVSRQAWTSVSLAALDAGRPFTINGTRLCKDVEPDASCLEREGSLDRYVVARSSEVWGCFSVRSGHSPPVGASRARVNFPEDGGVSWSALPVPGQSEALTQCVLDAARSWEIEPALRKGMSGSEYVWEFR